MQDWIKKQLVASKPCKYYAGSTSCLEKIKSGEKLVYGHRHQLKPLRSLDTVLKAVQNQVQNKEKNCENGFMNSSTTVKKFQPVTERLLGDHSLTTRILHRKSMPTFNLLSRQTSVQRQLSSLLIHPKCLIA